MFFVSLVEVLAVKALVTAVAVAALGNG